MKTFLMILAVSCTLRLHGQQAALTPVARPPAAPRTVADVVHDLRAPRADVVRLDSDDDSFLIPVAGNVAGNNGTYFKSDITFTNNRSVAQTVGISWLAQGQDNRGAGVDYYSLPANTFVAIDDFVATTLNKSGLGAIVVIAVNSAGAPDTAAQIDGFSRIWTRQPGSSGTVSQALPAVSLTDSIGSLTANVVGLKQSSQFRSNVGIVNFDTAAHTWTIRAAGTGAVTTVTVPPFSIVQSPLVNGSAGSNGNVALEMKSDGFGFWWSAYGTTVDNTTGDGWVTHAAQ